MAWSLFKISFTPNSHRRIHTTMTSAITPTLAQKSSIRRLERLDGIICPMVVAPSEGRLEPSAVSISQR
jgi:hypothetical protein